MPLAAEFLERFATKYPTYRLVFPFKDTDHFLVVDGFDLCRWKCGEVDESFSFQTKMVTKNGKPTKYWVLGGGALVPCAHTILTAFKGVRPGNYSLHYKDGDRENCRLSNLEWKPKENKEGKTMGVTFDKTKNRWRVSRTGMKRSCHKTKEEAIQALLNQGATVEVEDLSTVDEEPEEIIEPEELPEDDDPTPEEIALNAYYDKQFEENERRNKAEAEARRLKSIVNSK